ncbi:HD family phosphohydrolase [Paenibacillus thermoaerophilus]|uniref:HD family phosphohydrolase n=1 Tax=Paenibacillus thermoaerophilus TaxID=1215385 RepID=A0ABW2UZB9_9BACL|nr:HDIG domain-containing metalloprotein [Paenibacillus thermoaerophilus]TMV19026.1 HDIG domain-containing protein [Paenibacillus thermoaerophilus]
MQAKRPLNAPAQKKTGLSGWKSSPLVRFLLIAVIGLLTAAALADRVIPKSYQLEVNAVVEKTIVAPRAIENAIATKKAEKEAVDQVQPVHSVISQRNDLLVEQIFDTLEQINADEAINATDKASVYQVEFPKLYNEFIDRAVTSAAAGKYGAPVIEEMKKQLQDQKYKMPVQIYFKMPRFQKEELQEMRPVAVELVNRVMSEQISDAASARTRVAELVNQSQLTKSTQRELVQEIVRFAVTPNRFFDQTRTDDAKEEARNNVKPVMVQRGETLLEKGQIVTQEVFDWLKSERVLSEKRDFRPWIGLALWAGLVMLLVWTAVRRSQTALRNNNVQLLMLVCIYAINLLLIRITAMAQTEDYAQIAYLAPIGVGVMLIAILLESHIAFVAAILFAMIAGVVFNLDADRLFDMSYTFVAATVGLTAGYSVQRTGQRSLVLRAGIFVSIAAAAAAGSLLLLARGEGDGAAVSALRDFALPLLFAFAGGLITAVLVIGLLPFFESMFGILSPLKLVELSNPNHPLLRKLLTETPGTYHHSIMVANLSETAAEAIGANGLLCRVGSFYHDVGKTKRPSYFIENQTNIENPHDRIDPALSKSIIIAHARDGADMLKEYNIPKPIRDIAEQHHGTTLLKYFYHKALKLAEQDPERTVTEAEYRYPGPKAQSKEAAIVGIADCIEAAVRSLRNPTVEQIDGMVRKIIKDRLDDGQFNECDLTLKELDVIARTLNETLLGMFHSRIEYPPDEQHRKGEKVPS